MSEQEIINEKDLLTVNEASQWASNYLGRQVTTSNISYLVQYAKVKKKKNSSNNTLINKSELKTYFDNNVVKKEKRWKKQLGKDLNWALSFDQLREKDTTKHVHRLHPYKGKFIPQLVEYFLDKHTDDFKTKVFFNEGDTVLDPFAGSGTTLVQASELGINSVGIDISEFNCMISKVKVEDYNIFNLNLELRKALSKTLKFSTENFNDEYDTQLRNAISDFNNKFFPAPAFKHKIRERDIDEEKYSKEKLNKFLQENEELLVKNGVKKESKLFNEKEMSSFLAKWFSKRIKQELFCYIKLMDQVDDQKTKDIMRVILSRTARSCRSTTHSDLATLKKPQIGPYYCYKHKKICTPINSIISRLRRYTYDTVKRLRLFSKIRKNTKISIIHDDSRTVDIFNEIKKENPEFYKILEKSKIDGVFTSPPYVGQINYHEQHAYAYELFDIPRKDEKEIGPLYKGKGKKARDEYVEGISRVLSNISKYMKDNGDFFIVANDKHNLYPKIAEKSNLKIINQFKRPVLNRTERDRQPYAEIIFHMKKN